MKRYLLLTLAVAAIFSWAGLAYTSAAHDDSRNPTLPWFYASPYRLLFDKWPFFERVSTRHFERAVHL